MRHVRLSSVFINIFVLAMMVGTTTWARTSGKRAGGAPQAGGAQAAPARPAFAMAVAGFADGGTLPLKYTPQGGEISPGITWTNPPAGTVSFVLSMRDMNSTHNNTTEYNIQWFVWNIPAPAAGIPEGIPEGAQLPNGACQISASGLVYRGPGRGIDPLPHHHAFELFAVDKTVDVPCGGADAFETRTKVMDAMQGHIIGKAMYLGLYHRTK